MIVYIAASLLQESAGIDVRQSAVAHGKTGKWYGYSAVCIIVMVASVRIFQTSVCDGASEVRCKRTKFGIALGSISFVGGVTVACLMSRNMIHLCTELVVAAFSLAMWCFGVGFLTFGDSPGATIGNLYFSAWISFIIIVIIFAGVFRDFLAARGAAAAHQSGSDQQHAPESPAVPDEDDI